MSHDCHPDPEPSDVCPCGEGRDDFGACWRCDAPPPTVEDEIIRGGQGRDAEEVRGAGRGCLIACAWLVVVAALAVTIAWMEGRTL